MLKRERTIWAVLAQAGFGSAENGAKSDSGIIRDRPGEMAEWLKAAVC